MTSKEAATTEFPRSIGKIAARELALSGYTRFEHLTQVSKKTLLAIHGVGPKSLNILEEELKKRGLGYKDSQVFT
jgi:DNA-directed RNA polymerase alpha subunit